MLLCLRCQNKIKEVCGVLACPDCNWNLQVIRVGDKRYPLLSMQDYELFSNCWAALTARLEELEISFQNLSTAAVPRELKKSACILDREALLASLQVSEEDRDVLDLLTSTLFLGITRIKREAFFLAYLEGLTYEQSGNRLRRSTERIRQIGHECCRKLCKLAKERADRVENVDVVSWSFLDYEGIRERLQVIYKTLSADQQQLLASIFYHDDRSDIE